MVKRNICLLFIIVFITTKITISQVEVDQKDIEITNEKTKTTVLWLFDAQIGLYPSSVIDDISENDYPLVLGLGGQIVPGKFGNALEPIPHPPIKIPEGKAEYGLQKLPVPNGRTVEPMTWYNANFCALMTSGEKHLRKEVSFKQPTKTKLNIGNFDWTIEFWFCPNKKNGKYGVVFEIGEGPRGENNNVTQLILDSLLANFILINQPANVRLVIPSDAKALNPYLKQWHHFAFVYSAKQKQLMHYVDGKLQKLPEKCVLKGLNEGNEDYMSIGRDGLWKHPLQGKIDELRFSEGIVYVKNFTPPKSFSPQYNGTKKKIELVKGLPLLFDDKSKNKIPIELGSRKYLFIDDAIAEEIKNITFNVNPPKFGGRVINNIKGQFRKHLTVVEDENGLIRMYYGEVNDFLGVRTSKDGIHWQIPDLGNGEYKGLKNITIKEEVGGLGNPFIDPNGPPEAKWKLITGYNNRGIYLYTSPDGFNWTRHKEAVLPFRSGTQSCTFYNDQTQEYVGYHRTGIFSTPSGATQRSSSLTETKDLYTSWKYNPLSQKDYLDSAKIKRLREPLPWWLDNGPLTPGGFGLELPHTFDPDSADPVGTDIYVTKAQKYQWAPDTYFAFPITYFHYEDDGPLTRKILSSPEKRLGSGPVETQIAVSRDGINWKRFYRPAYIGIGNYDGVDVHQVYIAVGMIKMGNEIWQYFLGNPEYHSSYQNLDSLIAVYRTIQRIDGFISADSPYDKYGIIKTKPLIFKGNRLVLNINTGATGYAQVGFLDENGNPIKGFSVDDCVYINDNAVEHEVEWLNKGKSGSTASRDVSSLEGKVVQLVFRMRGTKLYSMQFIKK
ncbi:LamG-like jellyroll fold domain-containing protein [Melioribacteraceae bacterium 4301-Me]|uniref:LamG-like jellyroll fold domain-containing protein n=1 Tax=Pyranulibacter aquaticus TaxID=3163344 RepID=UPI0035961A99